MQEDFLDMNEIIDDDEKTILSSTDRYVKFLFAPKGNNDGELHFCMGEDATETDVGKAILAVISGTYAGFSSDQNLEPFANWLRKTLTDNINDPEFWNTDGLEKRSEKSAYYDKNQLIS